MQETVFTKSKGTVRLYACGGGGVNIGARFETYRNAKEPGFAMISPVYIDTSKSNVIDGFSAEHFYKITRLDDSDEELDGSGQKRDDNYEEIAAHTRSILQQHKPLDLNIVLSTGGGGSGSVIAPSLVGELLEREAPTIVITIGAANTRNATRNTLNTLKSYENIAKTRRAPVVMAYVENSEATPRSHADKTVESVIYALCVLFSRENRELDSRDLFNWLRYDRVTSFPVGLTSLTLINDTGEAANVQADLQKLGNVISVATVSNNADNTHLPVMTEYHCIGFLQETGVQPIVAQRVPLHFVVTDGVFGEVTNHLNTTLRQFDEAKQARVVKKTILDTNDRVTDNGVVL